MARSTVVVGWDGLDHELACDLGVAEAFAPAHREIETFDSDALGTPQTYELWPSIITGLRPREHGLRLFDAADADSLRARLAKAGFARLTQWSTLPLKAFVLAGLALQDRGVTLSEHSPAWYRDRGLRTVFDGVDARPLAVPNYRTARDEALDSSLGWSRRRARYLESEPDWDAGTVVYRPTAALDRIERWLASDVRERLHLVRRHAADADLVFCWLPTLDAVGHLTPAVGADVQERAYETAARATTELRDDLDDDTRLVVVSDHGHRGGAHTHSAFLGDGPDAPLGRVEDVTDVYDYVRDATTD